MLPALEILTSRGCEALACGFAWCEAGEAIHVSKRVAYREREGTPGRRRQNCSSDSASTDSLPRVMERASATACGSRHSA
jgi:hypothetical protein